MTRPPFCDTAETVRQVIPPIIATYLVIAFLLGKMATKATSMGLSEKLRAQLRGYHNTPPARLIRILVV